MRSPEYEIDEIEHWGQWSERHRLTGLSARDTGIDLVARHRDGSWIAIQCKCYAPTQRVAKSDIDSFLAVSQASDSADRPVFAMRWIVATSPWTNNAAEQVDSLGSSVRRIDFLRHEYESISEKLQERPVRDPWPRQREAIDKVVAGLLNHDRGRMVMACGTGKTFTALRIAEAVVPDGGCIAFVAPSIALVAQARREWLLHTARPLDCVVVCSDDSAGGRRESAEEMRVSELECPVTISPQHLGQMLNPLRRSEATRVVFCTYQSLHRVCEAQQSWGAAAFDLLLCDEAHRTTGAIKGTATRRGKETVSGTSESRDSKDRRHESGFRLVHDNSRLHARKRLYMTATPRIYTPSSKKSLAARGVEVVDMNDAHVYGPQLEHLSFKESVEQDLLSDYRVIVLGVHSSTVTIGVRKRLMALGDETTSTPGSVRRGTKPLVVTDEDLQRLLGTSLAINGMAEGEDLEVPQRLDRTIVFANSIARSKFYAQGLDDPQLRSLITRRRRIYGKQDSAVPVEASHLDGTVSAFERGTELRKLAQAGTDRCARVICNAKLLTEGVDVPSLDAVVFMEPRDSQVDIVQAVGRVMRRAPGKKLGYIVIPVPVRPGADLATELQTGGSGYEALGQVLLALQSHDGRLAETPANFVKLVETSNPPGSNSGGREGSSDDSGSIDIEDTQLVFDLHKASDAIYAQVVAASGLGSSGKLVADDLAVAVSYAGARLNEGALAQPLATALGGLSVDSSNSADICKVAALVLINACLLHRRLRDVPRFNDIADLASVTGAAEPIDVLADGWQRILEHDYAPVFGPALKVLQQLPSRPFAVEALCSLAECANRTADSLSEMGYDHAGPLYHRILPNAEAYGAFYTKNLTALMLARLAINDSFVDWSDADAVTRLKIMDPACGTGTLLMAALRVLKQRIMQSGLHTAQSDNGSKYDETELHKTLVENVLYGLDINSPAIQFAASNFTLGAPTVDYQQMNLFTLKHGPQPDGSMLAGTLEVLGFADSDASLRNLVQHADAPSVGAQLSDSGASFPTNDVDLVIMNPLFTNNVKKNSQFTPAQKKAMQQHELGLRDALMQSDPTAAATIDANSIQTYFTPIVERVLSSQGATLAMVLPATLCTGSSAAQQRQFLADRFWVETIVTSHDPKHINFSENTGIHECLLIARRRDPHFDSSAADLSTRFVSLRRMPATPNEALEAADAIASGDLGNWGTVTLWPADRVREGDWSPVQWYDGELAEIARSLEANEEDLSLSDSDPQAKHYEAASSPPSPTPTRTRRTSNPRSFLSSELEPVSRKHAIGPAGRRIQDAFAPLMHP